MTTMETATLNIDDVAPLADLKEPAGATAAAMVTSTTISADEVALYDRQIRLWGMEAQERMRNANVLIITMRALANEVAKNLVLAGIGSLTVLDSEDVVEEDLGAQFFVSEEHVGMNRAKAARPAIQKLNPRVRVNVDTDNLHNKPTEYFKDFDIVIGTELAFDDMCVVNEATRKWGVRFYAAATYGLYGFIFADLVRHQFVLKRVKANRLTQCGKETRTRSVISTTETKEGDTNYEFVTKEEIYCTLSEAVGSHLDKSWRPKKRHQVGSTLPGIVALWKFQQEFGRLPESIKDDYKRFTKLMTETAEALEMPQQLVKADFIRQFVGNVSAELSPVAAVLGGILAQDTINVLGKMEQPIQNILLFDGDTSEAPIIVLVPQED